MSKPIRWTQDSKQDPKSYNCTILLTVPGRRFGSAAPLIEGTIRATESGYLYAIQYKMAGSDLVYHHNIPGQPNADDVPTATLPEAKAAVQAILENDFLPRLQKSLCRPRVSGSLTPGTEGTLTYRS